MTVTNTGEIDGCEVVQVYVRKQGDAEGPNKTLRAFQRVQLKAGESKKVEVLLPRESFEWWDAETNTMRVQKGKFDVLVGNSSDDKDLQKLEVKL